MVDNKSNQKKKTKRKGNPSWKKGDPSPNPAGAPKRGESWKEIVKEVGNLTPQEADAYCHAIASRIKSIGGNVTLKQAVILRVFTALLFEPDARLLAVIMDRDEGKVVQPTAEIPWREYVRQLGYDPDVLMSEAEKIVNERFSAMGDQSSDSGSRRETEGGAQFVSSDSTAQ